MKPEDYIGMISKEMLQATAIFRDVFLEFMLTEKLGDTEEKGLKLMKKHLQIAEDMVDKLLAKSPYAYIVVLDIFGEKQHVDCDSKDGALELAKNFHGDDGKAYIFTNDLTVGGREESTGGTIICENTDKVYEKAEAMMKK